MDDFGVVIICCDTCSDMTIVPHDKQNDLKHCAYCGATWDDGKLYIGGTATITSIVENG